MSKMSNTVISNQRISSVDPSKKSRTHIPGAVALHLWVKSGGRCEFKGCNKDLYKEGLTLKKQKLGEVAHIVAAELTGPRGDNPLPINDRNKFENLMLVCGEHHKHFDVQYVKEHPVELLTKWKKEHEKRIEWLLSIRPNAKSKIVRLLAKIGGESVSCSESEIREAILPKYPLDENSIEIDLRSIPESGDEAYWTNCKQTISENLKSLHVPSLSNPPIDHISIFGFAPIPLLIHLGRSLGNKIPATIYQRHRGSEKWLWNTDSPPVSFSYAQISHGNDEKRAVVLISLSGKVAQNQIPDELLTNCDVYELIIDGQAPNTSVINTPEDLERFRRSYQEMLGTIRLHKPNVSEIHLFPAIPISVAICCGRELLEKAHPCLVVYDRNKRTDKFQYTLRVNE